MSFEWDAEKNRVNVAKHGVCFEDAMRVFEGRVLSRIDNRFDYGEVREISIGMVDAVAFLVVVHTRRGEARRIISARPASKKETLLYEATLR